MKGMFTVGKEKRLSRPGFPKTEWKDWGRVGTLGHSELCDSEESGEDVD